MAQGWDDTSRVKEAFAALVTGISQIVWLSEEGGHWTWASPSWKAYTGLSDQMSLDLGWMAAIPANEHEWFSAAWQDAPSRGVLDLEHGLIHQPDGETRRYHTHGTPLPPRPGRIREWIGTCTEVHGTRQAGQQDDLPDTDLRHRILDVIALARLIVRQLPKADGSAEEFALRFESRLDSLARTQAATASHPGAALDLEQIVTGETMLHMAHESGQVQAAGPAIPFIGKAASTFGLVVHELVENSILCGALSMPAGSVSMTWRVDPGDLLRFEWLETGLGARDGPPPHYGLDQKSIDHMLADELGGAASLDVGPNSIRCSLTLPLKVGAVRALRE